MIIIVYAGNDLIAFSTYSCEILNKLAVEENFISLIKGRDPKTKAKTELTLYLIK